MTDTVHKGQKQVVEGSATGDYYVQTLLDWGSCGNLIYVGEVKTGVEEHENRHFIQKIVYDANNNPVKMLIAQNRSSLGCTSFSYEILSNTKILVTLNSGDCTEVNKGDSFTYIDFQGQIIKKIDDFSFQVEVNTGTSALTNATVSVQEFDLIVKFENEKTKDYTKRRWDHRTRYAYS